MSAHVLARGRHRVAWHSSRSWLDDVEAGLLSLAGSLLLSELHVASHKVYAVAMHDARTATPRTGGDVATAHETVAKALGISKRVVQRARAWLIRMGLVDVVEEGRYLTVAERLAAGNGQKRAASTRVLRHPPGRPRIRSTSTRGHLPRKRFVQEISPEPRRSPSRVVDNPPGTPEDPKPMWAQRLAAGVAVRIPRIVPDGRHIGNLVTGLMKLALPRGLTAGELLREIDHHAPPVPPRGEEIRDPLAWFLHQAKTVRDRILDAWEHPTGPLEHVHDFRAVHSPTVRGCLTCPATQTLTNEGDMTHDNDT